MIVVVAKVIVGGGSVGFEEEEYWQRQWQGAHLRFRVSHTNKRGRRTLLNLFKDSLVSGKTRLGELQPFATLPSPAWTAYPTIQSERALHKM